MKKLMIAALGLLMTGTVYAADAENSETTKIDHSKNPITGTKKTTKTWKKKVKDGSGKDDATVKETTYQKPDGSTEKKTEVDADSTDKK